MAPRRLEPGYYDKIISICLNGDMSPLIYQEAEGVTHILSLVSAGIGVTLVTEVAQQEYPKNGIVYKSLKDSQQEMDLYITWNKNAITPITNTFIHTMKHHLQEKESP